MSARPYPTKYFVQIVSSFVLAFCLQCSALDIPLSILFTPGQEEAPADQFTLFLMDHYAGPDDATLTSTTIRIMNTGAEPICATEVFVSRWVDGYERGSTALIDGLSGPESSRFRGSSFGLGEVPQSIEAVFMPYLSYPVLSGPGLTPGYEWTLFQKPSLSVLDAFNAGLVSFGLKTADGFTYTVTGVPEIGPGVVLLALVFGVMAFVHRIISRSRSPAR